MRTYKITISVTVTTENEVRSADVSEMLDEYIYDGFAIGAVGVLSVKDTEVLGDKEVWS